MVICCIGTPKVKGDSIAPKVADFLIANNLQAYIYGTTNRPITALNYQDYFNYITEKHKNDIIIAIDCALGKSENIGKVKMTRKGVSPGKAIGKNLSQIGNIGILGQVGDISKEAFTELKNTPEYIIKNLVESISFAVISIVDYINYSKYKNKY